MEINQKRTFIIVGIVIVGYLVMAITDALIQPTYVIKSIIKAIFFLVIPLVMNKLAGGLNLKSIVKISKHGIGKAILLGVVVYGIILGVYFVASNFFAFAPITNLLTENVGVRKENFLLVALYISFANSLLEEFFFRGLAFLTLSKGVKHKWAHLFSSITFALYHIAIMIGWFSLPIFILALIGLAMGGFLFNILDERNGNIYNSWMVHMFANFAINTVGCMLFGLI